MSYKEETTSLRDITGNLQVYETPEFSIVIPYQEEARTVKTKPASKKRTLELLADYFSTVEPDRFPVDVFERHLLPPLSDARMAAVDYGLLAAHAYH